MFSQTEDFERCPICESPYFGVEVSNVIHKTKNRTVDTPILVTKEITEFRCKGTKPGGQKCNYLIGKFTNESEPKLYS